MSTNSGYPAGRSSDWTPQNPKGKACRFPTYREAAPFPRPAALDGACGEPVGGAPCAETAKGSGIFRREWTTASVELDCNSFKSKITMQ